MLSQHHPTDHIKREPRHESKPQAAGTRRLDRPVKDHQHQKIRPKRVERVPDGVFRAGVVEVNVRGVKE